MKPTLILPQTWLQKLVHRIQTDRVLRQRFWKYGVVSLGSFTIQTFLLFALTEWLGLYYLVRRFVSVLGLYFVVFAIQHLWVFKK